MDETTKQAVWNKADNFNGGNEYKYDQCGALVRYDDYGNENSNYGWEIDHINPKSEGGKDIISNFRVLHCKNNASRQAGRLNTKKPLVKAYIRDEKKGIWGNAILKDDDKYHWL